MKGFAWFRFGGTMLLLCAMTSVAADSGDLLSVSAGVTHTQFNNLFKRPSDGSAGSVSNDNLTVRQIGISARKQLSLQTFELGMTLVDNRYDQFDALNSRSDSHNAAWRWQFTPRISGGISSTRQQSQTDFADFRGAGQNLRTTETRRLNADWNVMGGWTVGAGRTNTKAINSQTFLQDASSEQLSTDIVLKYSFPSGSTLAWTDSATKGDYGRAADPLTLSDSRFSERRDSLSLVWPITGKTKLSASLGHVSRKNQNFSARDFGGRNSSLGLAWAATGKINLTLNHSHATESWEDTFSSLSERESTGLSGSWQMTGKIAMRASMDIETRTFGGFARLPVTFDRIDRTNKKAITLTWAALNNVNATATLQKSKRNSNSSGLDYADQLMTVSISATF
jgi:exopolysaccharide biosynthesis operon protein EpsL